MPQCSKCGKEISDYGLCARCAADAKRFANIKKTALPKPVCPNCGSKMCEYIGKETLRCCMCDFEFSAQKDENTEQPK